jgi:hypothetical protein
MRVIGDTAVTPYTSRPSDRPDAVRRIYEGGKTVGQVRVAQGGAWLQLYEIAAQRLPFLSILFLPANPSPPDCVLHTVGKVVSPYKRVIL